MTTSTDLRAAAIRTIATEIAGLDALRTALDGPLGDRVVAAIEILAGVSGRVIVTGMGKSGHVGRKIAATLASTGTPAHFVHPAEASHGDLGMITADDAILALSWSGETVEMKDIVGHARRFRVPLVAMTSSEASTLGREASVCLALPRAQEACPNGLAPTTSTTMQLALGDAIAVALLEKRGFSAQDFGVFHPGGKLGAQLKQVRDIMHVGARLPVVRDDVTVADAVKEMSAKGFGCTLVTDSAGRLAGFVTDGDLRRNLRADLMTLPVGAIMTRQPMVVSPDTLLAAALDMQERRKVTVLIVAEDGRATGLVHYLDLLRAGVA